MQWALLLLRAVVIWPPQHNCWDLFVCGRWAGTWDEVCQESYLTRKGKKNHPGGNSDISSKRFLQIYEDLLLESVLWPGSLSWDEEEVWSPPSHPRTAGEGRQGCSRSLLHFACFLTKGAALRAQNCTVTLSLFGELENQLLTALWGCEALLEVVIVVTTLAPPKFMDW